LCGRKDKLYIRKTDGRFRCFKCAKDNGFSGSVEYALIELTDIPLPIIKQTLYGTIQEQASFLDLSIRDFFGEEEEQPEELEEPPNLTWPYYCIPILHGGAQLGRDYLQGRGISPEIADIYQIRYAPEKRAIVFPVYVGETLYGWQFRTIDKTRFLINDKIIETPKAWSSPNLPRDKVFMFSNRLLGADKAVICEGPIDTIKVHLFGNGNVCTMGKDVSSAHVATILRSGIKKVYVGLDPDAFAELDPLISKLGNDVSVLLIKLPESKDGSKVDLGSLSMEEALVVVRNAEPMKKNRLYVWVDSSFLTQKRVE